MKAAVIRSSKRGAHAVQHLCDVKITSRPARRKLRQVVSMSPITTVQQQQRPLTSSCSQQRPPTTLCLTYGQKKYFSSDHHGDDGVDFASGNPRPSSSSSKPVPPPEVAVDRFTHFCLNSNMVPLGSMKEHIWKDAFGAVRTWLERIDRGHGYAIDSAGRLLDRLWVEHWVRDCRLGGDGSGQRALPETMSMRQDILLDLQRRLFYSWMECATGSKTSSSGPTVVTSQLALRKAEDAFVRLRESLELTQSLDDNIHHGSFPLEEYVAFVQVCLDNEGADIEEREVCTDKAARWLLQYANTTTRENDDGSSITRHEILAPIGPLLERCVVQLLTLDPHSQMAIEVLETMENLKESGDLPDLTLPDEAERILLEASITQSAEYQERTNNKKSDQSMSTFEMKAVEMRLIDTLKTSDAEHRSEVEKTLDRISTFEPSNELLLALVDFYVRVEDPEKASFWLQRLDDPSLKEFPDALEKTLLSWSKQQDAKTPFRADEVLKTTSNRFHVHQEGTFSITLASFKIVLDLWASSDDPGANRKILDVFSSLVGFGINPDGTTLRTALHAAQKEKLASSFQMVCFEILNQWKNLDYENKVWLSEGVLTAMGTISNEASETVDALLDLFKADNIKPTASTYSASLAAIEPESAGLAEIWRLVESFERNLDHVDLSLYKLAIEALFRCNGSLSEIDRVCDKVLHLIGTESHVINSDSLSEFMESTVQLLVARKYFPAAASFVQRAEEVLLTPRAPGDDGRLISPISLHCYKLMIVRKWYTRKTAPAVKHLFDHLTRLHQSGFENLQPDNDIITAYMRACSALGEDVEPWLEELIKNYESSGDDQLKPTTEAFNLVLLDYSRKNVKVFQSGKKAVQLLKRMVDLGIRPDTKSLNFALHSLTKGSNRYAFEMTTKLLNELEALGCKPEADSFTLHYILDACAGDGTTTSDTALKTCLSAFREIREKEMIGSTTYGILSKVLCQLLSKGDRADKIAGSILVLCCEDGRLVPDVRDRFQSLMSRPAWIVQYERQLLPNGEEPEKWSRNVPAEAHSEDAA